MITRAKLEKFIMALCLWKADRTILVGRSVLNQMNDELGVTGSFSYAGFQFLECDLLEDNVVITGNNPFKERTFTIDDILKISEAFTSSEKLFTVIKINDTDFQFMSFDRELRKPIVRTVKINGEIASAV